MFIPVHSFRHCTWLFPSGLSASAISSADRTGTARPTMAPGPPLLSLRDRYSRQIRFAPHGAEGQERLSASVAVIVGCGALGTVQASLLARAGIGTLRLIDRDYVEENNLQRQPALYRKPTPATHCRKREAARRHFLRGELDNRHRSLHLRPSLGNVEKLLGGRRSFSTERTNLKTRLLINDYAVREHVPWIYGAAVGGYGIAMAILPGSTRRVSAGIYPEAPPAARSQPAKTAWASLAR